MTIGANVGLKFHEGMSGYLADGVAEPEQAERLGKGKAANFAFRLQVTIPHLRAFLNATSHEAQIDGGSLLWEGHARNGTPIAAGGSLVMYRNLSADGRHKEFDFTFSFQTDDHVWHTVSGRKRLADDHGLDAGADLSTLFVRVTEQGSGSTPAVTPTVAAGVTRVHVDELLDQIISMSATGAASAAEGVEARTDFLTFMNDQIHQVYPGLPFLFRLDPDRYLTPGEWRALALIVSVMLPRTLPPNGPTIKDTVGNLQNFIRASESRGLDQIRLALKVLGVLAPIAEGLVEQLRSVVARLLQSPSASPERTLCELLYRVAVLPYFSHPKADALVGYRRPQFEPAHNTLLGVSDLPSPRFYDVAIVGAGVAGSLLAERLTRAGKSVIVLEAGPYLAERHLTTDELVMTATLYKSAGLQTLNEGTELERTTGAFPLLQAACVGGGGAINNAVCLQLPEARLAHWHSLGFPIASAELRAAYATVAAELGIQPASAATSALNPAGQFLSSLGPIQKPRSDLPPPPGVSECLVNIEHGCRGLGLCNSGCGEERKRNALQVYLPRALASRACQLVPHARVLNIQAQHGAVTGLDVDVAGRRVPVRAGEYVLSAGPVASSVLLSSSPDVQRLLSAAQVPVGERFSANVGSPLFGLFRRVIHRQPSLQICHYYLPPDGRGFILESWHAPPGTLALALPGFFDVHWQRVLAYAQCITLAPLIGTQARGSIRLHDGKPQVRLPIEADDFEHLRNGVVTVARALLNAHDPDLLEVLAGTRLGFSLRNEADVQRYLDSVRSPAELRLSTGHPQGGNAMSGDPRIGVVQPDFRVRGFSNLRVCDASLFPDVAGVNPQWTVMAMADRCAAAMLQ
jgi:choline dehydrogenase-like flavoprotein